MNNPKIKKPHPLSWIIEPLLDEPSYIEKPMFGALGCYLRGRLVLVLASRGEPWNGLLIPTEKNFHQDLMAQFKSLLPHSVLGKWLYLPENDEEFESTAVEIVEHIYSDDPRFGVEPKPRVKRKKK